MNSRKKIQQFFSVVRTRNCALNRDSIHRITSSIVVCILAFGICLSPAFSDPAFVIDEALTSKVQLKDANALDNVDRPMGKRQLKSATPHQTAQAAGVVQKRITGLKAKMAALGTTKTVITPAQKDNLVQLLDSAPDAGAVRVAFDKTNGTPTLIKVKEFTKSEKNRSRSTALKSDAIARQFLRSNRQLLKLEDPDGELTLAKSWTDTQGGVHYRYRQMVGGIPVYGKQLLVHLDSNNDVYMVNGRFEPTPTKVSTTPAIASDAALEVVRSQLALSDLEAEALDLVVFAKANGDPVLAYAVSVAPSLDEGWTYFINAMDGTVVHRLTRIQTEIVPASGTDLNSIQQTFNAWHQGSYYYLIDPSTPQVLGSYSADYVSSVQSPGNTYVLTADNTDGSSLYHIRSSSNTGGWDAAGVSLMAHIKRVYNYYDSIFDRAGIDDQNLNYMAVVHLGQNYANAFWNGTYIVFGDGDNQTFSNLAASLDIAAHEIQHGITQFTANLKYENQSGALNEAYSDLFACMVDNDDWTVGEDCTIPSPGYLRNLANPAQGLSALPRSMSEYRNLPNTEDGDWGGVHINMSIASRAGYLMAEGLSSGSIGRAKTAAIWYRALTTYLTPYSQFTDARNAMVQSATDLHYATSPEVAAVKAAWDTVEVYGDDNSQTDPTIPTPGDIVSGDDVLFYLYPADNTHNPYADGEHYILYGLLDPASGYSSDNDLQLSDDESSYTDFPRYTKTAAYTAANGNTIIFFATEGYDLHAAVIYADGTVDIGTPVYASGEFFSIALSPDGRYFAYTTPDASDNHVYVLDLEDDREGAFALEPITDAEGGNDAFNTILYADSLAFDFTGKTLTFDALNCVSTQDSSCAEGGGYRYWSIGFLYLADDPVDTGAVQASLAFPFPNQSPIYDISYPAFATNNSYVLAVDFQDYTDYYDYDAVDSMVLTLNGSSGDVFSVVNPDRSGSRMAVYGVPSFWGGDDAVSIQWYNGTDGSIDWVPIDDNFAGPADGNYVSDGRPSTNSVNDYSAAMPLMHRMAVRSASGSITLSAQALTFDNTTVGTTATKSVTLTNSSARDIRILNISLSGNSQFRHNGTNGLLPRGSQLAIAVSFDPTVEGSASATLTISSDADISTNNISLSGNTPNADSSGDTSDGGGGGGGCLINILLSE